MRTGSADFKKGHPRKAKLPTEAASLVRFAAAGTDFRQPDRVSLARERGADDATSDRFD